MKRFYKIFAVFFMTQATWGSSGLPPQYLMQLQQQQQQQQMQQQQGPQQTSMPAPQWANQRPQGQISPMQWPMMMARPMQRFGQSPQMGGYGAPPQVMGGGFMGQQQSLSIPAGPGATTGMGMGASPQIQNQSRMPAGGNGMMAPMQTPQQGAFQTPPMQGRGGTGR